MLATQGLSALLLLLVLALTAAPAAAASTKAPAAGNPWTMDPRRMTRVEANCSSTTVQAQAAVEEAVWARYQQQRRETRKEGEKEEDWRPVLHVETHVRLLRGVLKSFPEGLPRAYAASVPWCYYWCCHALDLLGAPLADDEAGALALRSKILGDLRRCLQPDGGFSGLCPPPPSAAATASSSSSSSSSHVLSTYAALATIAILSRHDDEAIPAWLDLPKLGAFLRSLKRPDGSFRATPSPDSETDARTVYGALAVARLAGLLPLPLPVPQDKGAAAAAPLPLVEGEALAAWLCGLQTPEGGFSAGDEGGLAFLLGPGEAHAGFSYCALAALRLLGATGRVRDREGLLRWAVHRQMPFEGGMQGRANKLVDACYGFWAAALPPLLLQEAECGSLLHGDALASYLLLVSQEDAAAAAGGFADKPGSDPDYHHTCYALSGLSLAVHQYGARIRVGGAGGGSLQQQQQQLPRKVDLALNLCEDTLRAWDAAVRKRQRRQEQGRGSDDCK